MAEREHNPTVKEIVRNFLKNEGYEGLFNEDAPCACKLDELICCEEFFDCEAGYIVPCDEEFDGEFDYCISREKPNNAEVN